MRGTALVALAALTGWALLGTLDRRLGTRATRRRLHPAGHRRIGARLPGRPRWLPSTAGRVDAVAHLPDAVDALAVAARIGLAPQGVVGLVAERAPPPWNAALVAVLERTRRGERFADALDELGRVGDGQVGQPLRAVLRAAADDGADLVPALDRLAADARDLRRRRAEEAARRVPVRLLLPLVACSLPAFALLTIVPIVAGALRGLAIR